jgi:hypothetical protein
MILPGLCTAAPQERRISMPFDPLEALGRIDPEMLKPRDAMMQLFVGTNVVLGSQTMRAFVIGIRNVFVVSIALCVLASGFSLVRGKENRGSSLGRVAREGGAAE